MKTIKRIFLLAFSTLIFANVQTLNAQVTIGSEQEPNAGALLDLKENTDGSSTKGFNLPRVELKNLTSLEPCVKNATDTDKANHKGLQVYNTNTNIGEGIYTWSGKEWATVSQVLQSPSDLLIFSATVYFTDYITYPIEVTTSSSISWAEITCTKTGFYYYYGRYYFAKVAADTDPVLYSYITTDKDAENPSTNATPMSWKSATSKAAAGSYDTFWLNGVTYLEAGKTYYLNFNTNGTASIRIGWIGCFMNFMKIN